MIKPRLEPLQRPPIVEVVCGFLFDAVPGIDPVALGEYWAPRKSAFPNRILQPPLGDAAVGDVGDVVFELGPMPTPRVWLVSADDVFVLQIQPDRFYMNWRARAGSYPRFGDHDGQEGLLTKALREFDAFAKFAAENFGVTPTPKRLELTKIDHFDEGKHWDGQPDLALMLPWLGRFIEFSETGSAAIGLRFSEKRDSGVLSVSLDTAMKRGEGAGPPRVLKLETRIVRPIEAGAGVRAAFEQANAQVNAVFESLVPAEQRAKRFQ